MRCLLQQENKKTKRYIQGSSLQDKFLYTEKKVYGHFSESHKIAHDESIMLWLAWRGDPEYLITTVGINRNTETSWRVIHYRDIPAMFEKYDHIESKTLGENIPEHMLADLTKFLVSETENMPGAHVYLKEPTDNDSVLSDNYNIEPNDSFKYLSLGKTVVARWPSKSSPALCTRMILVSNKEVRCSKYPSIDSQYKQTINTNKFMKFIEARARQRKHRSLCRWLLTG